MYKSNFRIVGWTGYIFVMGLLIVFLGGAFLRIVFFVSTERSFTIIYVVTFILLTTFFLWKKILTEMNQIEITDSLIQIKNPSTKRTKIIDKKSIKGFKDIFKNGYTILIIDDNDKVIAQIHDYYYKDFQGLINNLGLKYLERVPTMLEKIFKTNGRM